MLRLVSALSFILVTAGCVIEAQSGGEPEPASECSGDGDCDEGVCVRGACVECAGNGDCADSDVCCGGECRPLSEANDLCGCDANGGARSCGGDTPMCVGPSGAPVTRDTLADGTCGCGCQPSIGGALCLVDEQSTEVFCGCDRNDQDGTCGSASLDDNGRPHVAADTCTPNLTCTCFAADGPCGGDAPDCSLNGCADILADPTDCGGFGRRCGDEDQGVEGSGICVSGGCSCNDASDCESDTALNVDTCAFLDDGASCVCQGYRIGDDPAACPLGLECSPDGCVSGGVAYATEEALIQALY